MQCNALCYGMLRYVYLRVTTRCSKRWFVRTKQALQRVVTNKRGGVVLTLLQVHNLVGCAAQLAM
jgi:hypothetical protein